MGYTSERDALEAANARLCGERKTLRAALEAALGELQCLYHWLDRAVASEYRYNNDPALPGHREAAEKAANAITAALEQRPKES